MAGRRQAGVLLVAWVCVALVFGVLRPVPALAIPVFARIYDKPCGACHTVYPQLNPEGERFRANGLHGLTPAIAPIRATSWLEVPGTLPLALSFAAGGDFTKVDVPDTPAPVTKRFNLEFASVLVGAELGPYLAFLGDYAPLVTNPRTGEEIVNTRAGIAFLQAHADRWGWLGNLRAGLFELPLGTSPRVHRLSVQSYLTYNTDAFSLLGRPPPGRGAVPRPQETLSLSSSQLGVELSGLHTEDGVSVSLGTVAGSNNREDRNHPKDVFLHVGRAFGYHQTGVFLYYSPDLLDTRSARDASLRAGPDVKLYFRSVQFMGQLLVGHDTNPTGRHDAMTWVGGFAEADYRILPRLVSLLRFEDVGMPTFDDRGSGGSTHVRRNIIELTGGFQWLVDENLKLIVEASSDTNHDAVADRTVQSWAVTARVASAFWVFTPPPVVRWIREAQAP
jgi:hypothetical protein